MSFEEDVADLSIPMFIDHGYGVWTIIYTWRDAAEALKQFRKSYPNLSVTSAIHEKNRGKIYITTDEK